MALKLERSYKAPVFIVVCLKGIGQIMLQENAWTGVLFLVGIFYNSVWMGIATLSASIIGTITAKSLGYDKAEIDRGLYGFSAALVGAGIILFFKISPLTWFLIAIGSSSAAILQHFFIKRNISIFTLPFVLVSWMILIISEVLWPTQLAEVSSAKMLVADNLDYAVKSFGQVIFQNSVVSGSLFFIAIFINSPISALYALAGAVLSSILASQFLMPIEDISNGIFGFNAVLCAIVFAGNKVRDGVWVLTSVIISLMISLLMIQFNLIQLTFPFVAAAFITVLLKKNYKSNIFNISLGIGKRHG